MKKLIEQILKFGIVGIISFFVDFGVYTVLCNWLKIYYLFASVCSFVASVIVNNVLSMKFVFQSKDDMSKVKEFVMFVALSVVGMGINALALYVCIDLIYWNSLGLQEIIRIEPYNMLSKIFATGIVMVYNFVSRKIFLEKKEEG